MLPEELPAAFVTCAFAARFGSLFFAADSNEFGLQDNSYIGAESSGDILRGLR
jgi:hypothetical protein